MSLIQARRVRLRHAIARCDAAVDAWNKRSDELDKRIPVTGRSYRRNEEQLATYRRSRRADDPQLADAFSAGTFWQREVSRLSLGLLAEVAADQWLGWAETAS